MSSIKFRAVSEHHELADVLTLGGVIDEDHELESTLKDVDAAALRIDLGGVTRINEAGAHGWMTFVEALLARGVKVTLSNCAPAVVGQLNRTPVGQGELTIESVVVPYFCPECDEPRDVCCPTVDIEGTPPSPPAQRCESCDLVLQFDDDPKAYFRFLRDKNASLEDSGLSQVTGLDASPNDTNAADNAAHDAAHDADDADDAHDADEANGTPFALLVLLALVVLGAVVAYAAGAF